MTNPLEWEPMSKPHITMAHEYWARHLRPADTAIDATCGNGKDTACLAALVPEGKVFALDIQPEALAKARTEVEAAHVAFLLQSHVELPRDPSLRLVVYNLGYLPGGDKSITTRVETTLLSVKKGFELLPAGGALSLVCYPHPEGEREKVTILAWSGGLHARVEHHVFREGSPSFLWIIKL